ncbi:MAG: S8 family serine peptidase [Bacteroidales bacterium]|nr:S8 family serine peptidase [Bacteroidales bacterium]
MVTSLINRNLIRKPKIAFAFLILLLPLTLVSQEGAFDYFYRVYFGDKGENEYNLYSPEDLLTERAVLRRQKSGIATPDFRDIPVYQGYINQITRLGYSLHSRSKWMNTALFKTIGISDIERLLEMPFVRDVKIVRRPSGKSEFSDKLAPLVSQDDPSAFDRPLSMINGVQLHNSGFTGKGRLIAVLDGGFQNSDQIPALNDLRRRGGIKGTYDFVVNNSFVYGYHTHGTQVLSVLAGKIVNMLAGSAPEADYLLIRTEDTGSEFPVEEDYWVAGAEFADSLGADIISSSLGYFMFDDPQMDYKYSSMDGRTAFVTRAAGVAVSKGILVVSSAGNERNKEWLHIIAPSDGDSVLSAGAVDAGRTISAFSSAGPSADGRIKPDVATQGVGVVVQRTAGEVERASGTSFSCPVLSGMCACLMQAVPSASVTDIISAIRSTADRSFSPDSLYGYGIPDMMAAIRVLQDLLVIKPENESAIGPNPFTNNIEVTFKNPPGSLAVEIVSASGRLITRHIFKDYVSRKLTLTDLQNADQGIYFIRLSTLNGTFTHKAIKLKR